MVFVVSAPLPIGVAGAHACGIEPSCCDGSDEPVGVCPNICKQAGEEYRKQNEALLKIRKTVCWFRYHLSGFASLKRHIQGAKIRGTYVAFAHKEKTRLEGSIEQLKKDIVLQEKELTRLEGKFAVGSRW